MALSSQTWFNLLFAFLALGVTALLALHLRRPLAVAPASWLGKGQLVFVLFLWTMVIGNFERALAIGLETATVRALYGDRHAGHSGKHIRFGPEATWKLQPCPRAGTIFEIKPENIMIDASGIVKLADLGIAKVVEDSSRSTATITQPGFIMGTPSFMAPEQFETQAQADQREPALPGHLLKDRIQRLSGFLSAHPRGARLAHAGNLRRHYQERLKILDLQAAAKEAEMKAREREEKPKEPAAEAKAQPPSQPPRPAADPEWALPLASPFQIEAAHQAGLAVAQEVETGGVAALRFLYVPAGTFIMGDAENPPKREVALTRGFYLGILEVTCEVYRLPAELVEPARLLLAALGLGAMSLLTACSSTTTIHTFPRAFQVVIDNEGRGPAPATVTLGNRTFGAYELLLLDENGKEVFRDVLPMEFVPWGPFWPPFGVFYNLFAVAPRCEIDVTAVTSRDGQPVIRASEKREQPPRKSANAVVNIWTDMGFALLEQGWLSQASDFFYLSLQVDPKYPDAMRASPSAAARKGPAA